MNNSDTSWIKITNNKDKTTNFISISGDAKINGVKITSWNSLLNDTIKQNTNGSIPRPYILADRPSGNVNISNSELAFLGYNSYPFNGFVYAKAGNGSSIINNTFHNMWDGFYSDSSRFITIKDNIFYNNLRNVLDPHSGSHNIDIIGNLAYNNSKFGISCSENCHNILFDNNIVHDNGEVGLMLSLQTSNSTAKKNFVNHEKVGISIFSSSNNNVYDNLLKSNDKGIFISGNSSENHFYNNSIIDTIIGFDLAGKPQNNALKNNYLSNVSSPSFAVY